MIKNDHLCSSLLVVSKAVLFVILGSKVRAQDSQILLGAMENILNWSLGIN
jgi:hypothetical protein